MIRRGLGAPKAWEIAMTEAVMLTVTQIRGLVLAPSSLSGALSLAADIYLSACPHFVPILVCRSIDGPRRGARSVRLRADRNIISPAPDMIKMNYSHAHPEGGKMRHRPLAQW